MKLTKRLLAVICIIIMAISAISLTGCSLAENSKEEKNKELKEMVGKYEIVEMTTGGETYTEDELSALKTLGYTIELELKEDGTGYFSAYGLKQDITYDEDSMTIEGVDTPYTRSGSKITFEQDDSKLVFDKAE